MGAGGIHPLAERFHADATHGGKEFLALLASFHIDIEDARDGLCDRALGNLSRPMTSPSELTPLTEPARG